MNKYFTIAILLISNLTFAQQVERLDGKVEIICYASDHDMGTRIYKRQLNPNSQSLRAFGNMSVAAQQSATIEVTYTGFSEQAQAAFQAAVDIWAQLISSPVTIRIDANWEQLATGTLGSASWNTAFRNFEGAKELDTWYPVALAEKMAGRDLNDVTDADIVASFNRGANWYLGLDGNPGAGEFDLVSVVLHEIGHGLGFIDSYGYSEGVGSYGIQGFPFVFDLSLENTAGSSLTGMGNNSTALGNALTSNTVYFNSPAAIANNGSRPRLYAPTTWDNGSSIAHLNESTYPAGNPNSLMTPQIGANEVMHDPGQITLDMFGDMGWEYTYIGHNNRPNTEDISASSYSVTTSINSDVGYNEEEVFLYYSIDGFVNDTTMVQMTATGNSNEFSGEIASNNTEGQVYSYFITVKDAKGRVFSNPSLPNAGRFFAFQTAQDNTPPVVSHSAPNFIRTSDTNLILEAIINDFLPLESVEVEYFVNDQTVQTASMTLTDRVENVYTAQISLISLLLEEGDSIRYRIVATDMAQASNSTTFPATDLIKLNVVSTADPVMSYTNNFNNIDEATNDFFASGNFSIRIEGGFSNGAIHSDHPYSDGTGANNESDYTFELKVPIILNSTEAKINFDEIVLVEPGEDGTTFGDDEFWDYVIVEGSADGGTSWLPFQDGYDSRSNAQWLTTYNSAITDNNSTATGTESLYRPREINMLTSGNFKGGDEILIRFRLHADEAAHGWGWAIDNLNIQVDGKAPLILHDHIDYVTTTTPLELNAIVVDNFEVDSVALVSFVNDQEQEPLTLSVTGTNEYRALIDISSLDEGDVVKYRFIAFDSREPEANIAYLPSADGYFEIPIINFGEAQEVYSNNFNSATDDFVGNIFSVASPQGFSDAGIYSNYPLGFGLDSTSTFTYTLKNPIMVSQTMPYVSYDEIVLVEPFTDYVALEASKNNGVTWFQLAKYSSNSQPVLWQQKFQAGALGDASLFKQRLINLTNHSEIEAGDEVLLRFRVERASNSIGWGWFIDNLEIQSDVITSTEPNILSAEVQVYPNPVRDGILKLRLLHSTLGKVDYAILKTDGEVLGQKDGLTLDSENTLSLDISALPSGLYLLKVVEGDRTSVHKVMKLD